MIRAVKCHLCNEPIPLENARTDEHGNAVHQECYVKAIGGAKPLTHEHPPASGGSASRAGRS